MAAPAINVTGAAGGIGAAIAARLASDGDPLNLLDRAEARLPDGATGRTIQCDIADPVTVAATFATLRAGGWQVCAVANVAGRNRGARVEGLTEGPARMLAPRRFRHRDRCRPRTQGRAMRPPTATHPRLSLWGLA
jgi:NAD(P)-dependent dehydrogenase (short-subunit alcohol dehydrogenase family)